jgi:beta-xylosidase
MSELVSDELPGSVDALAGQPARGVGPLSRQAPETWQDPGRPTEERVADLLERMTLEEQVAQLYGVWLGSGDQVAPHQDAFAEDELDWRQLIKHGLGQLTRPFGTVPVDPATGAGALARLQAEIVAANRFGIPAVAHEECLTGFTTWQATIYPVPLAWGASFDPELVERMAAQIGDAMRQVGVHQGLAPVLDVVRDPRWGRTEETIGEDPYLVGTVGTAYVRGLQSAGIIATLKHFVGYSASQAGRNFAPVAIGRRELADVLVPPFEMAMHLGGARSVMHSYIEIDGLPVAADADLLTGVLRDTWGFAGTVVSDYFGVAFLALQHRIAGTEAEAAQLALAAGVDVELPGVNCYGEPLLAAVRTGAVPESLVTRSAARVLRQKCELGMLDPDWTPDGPGESEVDLDPPQARALARELAEESVVLLANDGVLPLDPEVRIAVVGPLSDDPDAMLGCYSFPRHVLSHHPDLPMGVDIPTVVKALRHELPAAHLDHVLGCTVDGSDTGGVATAAQAAAAADVCVVVLGDRAGLFGRGTSGEGCDREDLRLPGVQGELLAAVLATGTPTVLVLLTGRPYALGGYADRLSAAVQAFFPGEEGGPAVAGVLSGRVCPSGRLPVSVPRTPGGQPTTYLGPSLKQQNDASAVDPTPLYPFGHGLSYTDFVWTDVAVSEPEIRTDGEVTVALTVRNCGTRPGAEVVQLYLHDPVAQVTRPVTRLIGYARLPLAPGEAARLTFTVHADLTSFTGRAGLRMVEPGEVELRLASSSVVTRHTVGVRLVGGERLVDHRRRLTAGVAVTPAPAPA